MEKMINNIDPSQPVLVTGAGGYLASWVCKILVEGGYTVRGTVRSLADASKYGHLMKIAKDGPGRLDFFEADLLKHDSFSRAMKGCALVIHTASPFMIKGIKNAQRQLVDPAVEGTKNILLTAAEVTGVQRVVLTSSVVATFNDAIEILDKPSGKISEADWNLIADLNYQPYNFSKTLAEKTAWAMTQEQQKWDLVTINPAFILGPALSGRTEGTSADFMSALLSGRMRLGAPDLYFGVVDVREAALAHILAGFTPEANGRYILCNDSYSMLDIAQIIARKYSNFALPKKLMPNWLMYMVGPMEGFNWRNLKNNLGYKPLFDNHRSVDLGVTYRNIEETIWDQVEQLSNPQ
jgi:nucleoside-diphosphate-sugar epimerase